MTFIEDYYPEHTTLLFARHRMHLIAWLDLAFSLIFAITVLLTLGASSWWLCLFQLPHVNVWTLALGTSDARSGSLTTALTYILFIITIGLDIAALLIRFFWKVWPATATPWIDLLLMLELMPMILTVLTLLLSAQAVVCGSIVHDAACRQKYDAQEADANRGRSTMREAGNLAVQAQARAIVVNAAPEVVDDDNVDATTKTQGSRYVPEPPNYAPAPQLDAGVYVVPAGSRAAAAFEVLTRRG